MKHTILYNPEYALAVVVLEPDESIRAETGAMVSMSPAIQIETQLRHGLIEGIEYGILGKESLFVNTFTAVGKPGEVILAPPFTGDLITLELTRQTIYVQSGAFLACTPGIEFTTEWSGARGFFADEGLFILRVSGTGTLFLSSYGAIHRVDLAPGEHYIVGTHHLVAFDADINYHLRTVSRDATTSFASDEFLACEYTGPGRLYLQSRNPQALAAWLAHFRPRSSGDHVSSDFFGFDD